MTGKKYRIYNVMMENQVSHTSKVVGNLVYTLVGDIYSSLVKAGLDQKTVEKVCNERLAQYMGGDVRLRKLPSPTKSKEPTYAQPFAKKKNVKWEFYGANNEYTFSREIATADGFYPLVDRNTNKVVHMVSENSGREISEEDKVFLRLQKFNI